MPRGRFYFTPRIIGYFKRRFSFQSFRKRYFPPLTRLYRSFEELSLNPPDVDVLIAGSDQIWNPDLTGGTWDETYFLKFNQNGKKIAYAPSFGETRSLALGNDLLKMLSDFDALSIREQGAAEKIRDEFGLKMEVVCDPVMLVEDFSSFLDPKPLGQDFILNYSLLSPDITNDIAQKLSEKEKVQVRRVCDDWKIWKYSSLAEFAIGPVRWLNLINQASYVITDSFHATLFSILFQKKFVSFLFNKERGRSNRIFSLLNACGLESRVAGANESLNEITSHLNQPVDWEKAKYLIRQLRASSKSYLQSEIAN